MWVKLTELFVVVLRLGKIVINFNSLQDLELTTPVLEKETVFKAEKNPLLPLSQVWILSTTLPALYTQPILHSKPTPNCFNTQNFLSKFVSFWLFLKKKKFNSLIEL